MGVRLLFNMEIGVKDWERPDGNLPVHRITDMFSLRFRDLLIQN